MCVSSPTSVGVRSSSLHEGNTSQKGNTESHHERKCAVGFSCVQHSERHGRRGTQHDPAPDHDSGRCTGTKERRKEQHGRGADSLEAVADGGAPRKHHRHHCTATKEERASACECAAVTGNTGGHHDGTAGKPAQLRHAGTDDQEARRSAHIAWSWRCRPCATRRTPRTLPANRRKSTRQQQGKERAGVGLAARKAVQRSGRGGTSRSSASKGRAAAHTLIDRRSRAFTRVGVNRSFVSSAGRQPNRAAPDEQIASD